MNVSPTLVKTGPSAETPSTATSVFACPGSKATTATWTSMSASRDPAGTTGRVLTRWTTTSANAHQALKVRLGLFSSGVSPLAIGQYVSVRVASECEKQ